MDFLKDRGNIKWTAMMLPEHKTSLIELEQSQTDVAPPSLDPDRLTEIAELVSRAEHEGLVIQLRFWHNKHHEEVIGLVKRIDPVLKALLVCEDATLNDRWIEARFIVDVDIMN